MKHIGLMGRVGVGFFVSTVMPLVLMFLMFHGDITMSTNMAILILAGLFLICWIYMGIVRPVDELKAAAKRLEDAGADILLMPCNTAHYFYPAIQASTKCPILHMLRLTAEEIKSRGHIKVALLATDGTVKTGIYAKLFEEYGIDYMLPEPEEQRLVMSMIYDGIKADNEQYFDTEPIKAALRAMQQRGADAFVLGCTELPIAFDDFELDFPTVDPTRVLAKNAVLAAGYELKTK